jgi:metal-responsive CopG/Arc/MetJ family transcriptional regulator
MSKVMISLPEEFLRNLDVLADTEHRSRSELVREAVRLYVTTHVEPRISSLSARRAVARILKTHLRWPAGRTAESLIRQLREARYGSR